jgi:hypothetical protein
MHSSRVGSWSTMAMLEPRSPPLKQTSPSPLSMPQFDSRLSRSRHEPYPNVTATPGVSRKTPAGASVVSLSSSPESAVVVVVLVASSRRPSRPSFSRRSSSFSCSSAVIAASRSSSSGPESERLISTAPAFTANIPAMTAARIVATAVMRATLISTPRLSGVTLGPGPPFWPGPGGAGAPPADGLTVGPPPDVGRDGCIPRLSSPP